jgi:hypothetical protein
MRLSQAAGFAVTIAVVVWADLPIDWLVVAATLAGVAAMFVVDLGVRRRR